MFVHIFPNVSHIALVQISILVVSFIKSEVILSSWFWRACGVVSWGSMLNEAQSELILGKWWQLAAVSDCDGGFLVTAFSMFTDALRDALDPKPK